MADHTHIEWTDATWNPVTGCSVVSPGCTNCYAMKWAGTRLQHHRSRYGLTVGSKAGPVWNGEVRFNAEWLDQPLRWKRPRKIFVCAHGDLFHEKVPDEWIDRVFAVMALAPHHTFQVLTKRADRMRVYVTSLVSGRRSVWQEGRALVPGSPAIAKVLSKLGWSRFDSASREPLPNVWLGVSVENQVRADERREDFANTPAAIKYVSYEPALGPVDWARWDFVDQIISGGESGPDARPSHPDWHRAARDFCTANDIAFFFKQWGAWLPWQPEHLPNWKAQDGRLMDRHHLPDFNDVDLKGWTDACLYDGDDICVHERVGKKSAGRLLDDVLHSAFPEVRA